MHSLTILSFQNFTVSLLVFKFLFAFSMKPDEEPMKTKTNVLHPMFGEEQNKPQPVGDVPEFEDYAESGDGFFVPNQV